jgi:hypothetical protein
LDTAIDSIGCAPSCGREEGQSRCPGAAGAEHAI